MWQNGTQVDLGALPGRLKECAAAAINNAGQVVDQCSNAHFTLSHAFLWFRGKMRDLGALPGSSDGGATGLSSSGDVAGVSTPQGDSRLHGVLWKNGQIRDLGVLGSGYVQSIARGVNVHDQVVGWSTQSSGFEQAFEWANGTMTALKVGGGAQSEASAINNNGQIAGGLLGSDGLKPALWAGGPAIVLPTLGDDGAALAINQLGHPAGWVATSGGGSHAAIWVNRLLVDLGEVRNAPTVADAINGPGVVARLVDLPDQTEEAVALLEVKRLGARHGAKPPGRGHIDAPPGLR